MMSMSPRNVSMARLMALALLALAATLPVRAAQAQSIVATVNGDPVTSSDLAEREKVLRALGMPASASDAMESMVKSRVEASEINKYGIKVAANELAPAIQYYADRAHVSLEAMSGRLANSHADKKHIENFLSIHMAFNIYTRARNRAVEVSSADIDAELAHDPKIAHQSSYVLRQVIITVPPEAGVAGLQQAAKQMESVRARFSSCETGAKLVSEFPNLIVRDPVTRASGVLGEQLTALLDKTPVGHLTQPSRDSSGLASLAVCSRTSADRDTLRDAAQARVMARNIQRDADKLYEELRTRAVIVKTGQ
jgi:peptidyl-prolyl cis-trans isomerase SurA